MLPLMRLCKRGSRVLASTARVGLLVLRPLFSTYAHVLTGWLPAIPTPVYRGQMALTRLAPYRLPQRSDSFWTWGLPTLSVDVAAPHMNTSKNCGALSILVSRGGSIKTPTHFTALSPVSENCRDFGRFGRVRQVAGRPLAAVFPLLIFLSMELLERLIDFIERNSVEPQVYMMVPCAVGGTSLEVQWVNESNRRFWRFRPLGAVAWEHAGGSNLVNSLEKRQVDMAVLEQELRGVVMTHVVVSRAVVEAGNDIFGAAAVDRACSDFRDFLTEICASADKHASRRQVPLTSTDGREQTTSGLEGKQNTGPMSVGGHSSEQVAAEIRDAGIPKRRRADSVSPNFGSPTPAGASHPRGQARLGPGVAKPDASARKLMQVLPGGGGTFTPKEGHLSLVCQTTPGS